MKAALLAALLLLATPVRADDLPGIGDGKPLVIQFSPGGSVFLFRLKGLDLAYHHTPVIVDGFCASACTLLVDVAHANVCLTTNAILAYHLSWSVDDKGVKHYAPLVYETPGLNAYIASRGGLPQDDVMLVPFDQAKAFYRPCAGALT